MYKWKLKQKVILKATIYNSANKLTEPRMVHPMKKKKKACDLWKSGRVAQTLLIAGDKSRWVSAPDFHSLPGSMLGKPIGSVGVHGQQEDEAEMDETWPAKCQHAHVTHTQRKQRWHEDLEIKASQRHFDTLCLHSHESKTSEDWIQRLVGTPLQLCYSSTAFVYCWPPFSSWITLGSGCNSKFSVPSSHPDTNLLQFSILLFICASA